MHTLELTTREAILVRDALRFYNNDQLGRVQADDCPKEVRELTEQFAREREAVAKQISAMFE